MNYKPTLRIRNTEHTEEEAEEKLKGFLEEKIVDFTQSRKGAKTQRK